MNFTQRVVRAFFHHDSERDIIKALYCRIGKVTSHQPGKAKYVEARIRQYCEEYPHIEGYKELLLTIMKDITQDSWNWNDVARVFWTISLVDEAASFQVSEEERDSFREDMIRIVGERFRGITRYEWITMPLIENDSPHESHDSIPKVTWGDVAIGAFIAFMLGKFIA